MIKQINDSKLRSKITYILTTISDSYSTWNNLSELRDNVKELKQTNEDMVEVDINQPLEIEDSIDFKLYQANNIETIHNEKSSYIGISEIFKAWYRGRNAKKSFTDPSNTIK